MAATRVTSLPQRTFDDDIAFVRAVRKGISGQEVREAVAQMGGHRELVADIVGTSRGKLHCTYKKTALGKTQSEGILYLLRLFTYASTTFDSDEIVREWFSCEIPALSGSRPINLMDTFQGRAMVRNVLGRIEYGEFS